MRPSDWRCPRCRHWSRIDHQVCTACGRSPGCAHTQLTRAAIAARKLEYTTMNYLRRIGSQDQLGRRPACERPTARAALPERAAEHLTTAILRNFPIRKNGLPDVPRRYV